MHKIAFALSALLIMGCKREFNDSSVQHQVGSPFTNTQSDRWANMDRSSAEKMAAQNVYSRKNGMETIASEADKKKLILSETHPLTQRAQFWVRALDSLMRKKFGDQMGKIPVPFAVVTKNNGALGNGNASIFGVLTHFKIPVVLKPFSSPGQTLGRPVFLGGGNIFSESMDWDEERQLNAQSSASFVASLNNTLVGADCKLGIESNAIAISGTCADDLKGSKTSGITVFTSANSVYVSGDFFGNFEQEYDFVSILAHEMGHFYKSHASQLIRESDYDYFYFRKAGDNLSKPLPDTAAQKLGKKLLDIPDEQIHKPGAQALYKQALEKKLGYYTMEQEADELSLEILSLAGIPLNHAVRLELQLLKILETSNHSEYVERRKTEKQALAISWSQCNDLQKNGWKDSAGKPFFVPVGSYNTRHHSSCYRAFNIDREIAAHNYTLAQQVKPPASPTWAEIIEISKREGTLK